MRSLCGFSGRKDVALEPLICQAAHYHKAENHNIKAIV
jgi:hypothetical protein